MKTKVEGLDEHVKASGERRTVRRPDQYGTQEEETFKRIPTANFTMSLMAMAEVEISSAEIHIADSNSMMAWLCHQALKVPAAEK